MSKKKQPQKFSYRLPPNKNEIRGLELNIDIHTQKLCETYNASSGATRSVLYVLLLLCVISLIAVFNSNRKFNWTNDRVVANTREIKSKEDSIKAINNHNITTGKKYDTSSIRYKIDLLKHLDEDLLRSDVDDNYTVKFSVLGLSIDINDLPSISGLSIILLLIVLRFTLTREKYNLKLALNSINERYPSDADYLKFKALINESRHKPTIETEEEWDKIIADINFVRRRYHYNFLSMNDVFDLPYSDISENTFQARKTGRFINKYLFYFFLIVYSYIILNGLCFANNARELNPMHAYIIGILSSIFYILIFNICNNCVEQKKINYKVFKQFWQNDYTYDFTTFERPGMRNWQKVLIPVGLLVILLISSFIFFPTDSYFNWIKSLFTKHI